MDSDCRGDWCLTGQMINQCTAICFTDADCIAGWHCVPQLSTLPSGNYLQLACSP
jgi:hypothetical protein